MAAAIAPTVAPTAPPTPAQKAVRSVSDRRLPSMPLAGDRCFRSVLITAYKFENASHVVRTAAREAQIFIGAGAVSHSLIATVGGNDTAPHVRPATRRFASDQEVTAAHRIL